MIAPTCTLLDGGIQKPAHLDSFSSSMVLIGNPGSGKSSLINCLVQENLFRSGLSKNGTGVTASLDVHVHNDKRYMDTPGLSDISLRRKAAEAIDGVLQSGGDFQICFVLTVNNNRVQADDVTTMKLVLDAANQLTQDSYAIIFNQWPVKKLKQLNKEEFLSTFLDSLASKGCPTSRFIHIIPMIEDLDGENNVITKLPDETLEFFANMPRIIIDNSKVEKVKADAFDEILEQCEQAQAALAEAQEAKRQADQAKVAAENARRIADEKARNEKRAKEEAEAAKRTADEAAKKAENARQLEERERKQAEKDAAQAREAADEARRIADENAKKARQAAEDSKKANQKVVEEAKKAKEKVGRKANSDMKVRLANGIPLSVIATRGWNQIVSAIGKDGPSISLGGAFCDREWLIDDIGTHGKELETDDGHKYWFNSIQLSLLSSGAKAIKRQTTKPTTTEGVFLKAAASGFQIAGLNVGLGSIAAPISGGIIKAMDTRVSVNIDFSDPDCPRDPELIKTITCGI